jgi:hypothetical protein
MAPHVGETSTVRSGALAGAGSALAFTILHHLTISNIWFAVLPMLLAGAACGLCVAWSYDRLFPIATPGTWIRYNAAYVVLLVLLGAASIVAFEPVTTIAELVAAGGPPDALIATAMPLTIAFTLVAAVLIGLVWGRSLGDAAAVLVTCTVVVLLLGLNVSALGLVHVPSGALYLVAEMFGLIVALNAAYVLAYGLLERRRLHRDRADAGPHEELR